MAGGYTIPINSETKAYKQGIETGVIKPTEDAQKALEDLGKTRGPEQLERDLRDAQKTTEKLADETKDTARAIEQEYRDSYRKMKNSADDAFDGAKRGADDFKSEASQSIRETAASFSSVEDGLDAVQEIAANAFSGFGPVGAGAGLVAALGLGLVTEELRNQQEAADRLKERLTSAYIEAAAESRNYLDAAQITSESAAIYEDAERLAKATADATRLGIDRQLVVQAMAGDEDALNAVIQAGIDLQAEAASKATDRGKAGESILGTELQQDAALVGIVARYREQLGIQDEARAKAQEYLGIVDTQKAKEAEQSSAAREAMTERGRALEDFYKKASNPPNPTVRVDVDDSGLRDIESRVRALDGRSVAIRVEGQTGAGRFIL